MENNLEDLIHHLKQIEIIATNTRHVEMLNSIDQIAKNDFYKAYLLGYFFKHILDSDNLPAMEKRYLINTIKQLHLADYFYLKIKPDHNVIEQIVIYLFIIIGCLALITGVVQLIREDVSVGIGTRYLVPIVREGGYKIIIGLVLFISGIFGLKVATKRTRFLKSFFKFS